MQDVEICHVPNPLRGTPSPRGLGSIDTYIRYINRFPLLSVEEECALARRLRDHCDLEAARALILPHLRFVIGLARSYAGYGLPHSDLIQEGNIGLMKAVRRFDPERGARLATYAIHWIRAEINGYILRNWRLVKIASTKAQRKLFFNLRAMRTGLAPLTSDEVERIAKMLHVKHEEVRDMETRLSGGDIAFDRDPDQHDSGGPVSYLFDSNTEPSCQLEAQQTDRARARALVDALSALDPRSRRIIEARRLPEGRPVSLHDLASEFNVSAERIRQIEARALQKMREVMQDGGLPEYPSNPVPVRSTQRPAFA